MIYLICQDWLNTTGNHAGMAYLCGELQRNWPDQYTTVCTPHLYANMCTCSNPLINKIQQQICGMKMKRLMHRTADSLIKRLEPGDTVILMEYLVKSVPQIIIAEAIKKTVPKIPVYGLVHLVPEKLDKAFNAGEWRRWTEAADRLLTLGHSLSDYIQSRGVPAGKIGTLFHYVDTKYYKKSLDLTTDNTLHVLAMGNQMRNIDMLRCIVNDNSDIEFTICQGLNDMRETFKNARNVTLIPFVPEDELRDIMDKANISLNVMHDTIGSNVITTSLAMGLAMVVSDVGSIRDYCTDGNSIFCSTPQSFSLALRQLASEPDRLLHMRESAIEASRNLSIARFHETLHQMINSPA